MKYNVCNEIKENTMKNYRFLVSVIMLVVLVGISTGCDNRSQLEKDADKAASSVKKALN